ncbi:MAG: diguanylate cyclase [Nitrospirota bacterium]|nr:diguanylate cyclase [Nitrospirota bacterium]
MTALRDYKPLFYSKLTETHLFSEVGRIIASELESRDLIRKIIAAIGKSIQFEEASVYVVKKDLTGLIPMFLSNPAPGREPFQTIYFDNGAPGEIAASGEPLILTDCSAWETFLHFPGEQRRSGSYVGIPLKNDIRIVGVMGFSHSRPSAFTVDDFDLLRTLSHTISAGIEKADLFMKAMEIARSDELTGLFNYRVLLEKLAEEIGRQARTGRDLSFIMIDIDNFKRVNDRYGHLEGSRVLAQLGALLRDTFRTGSTDSCYRYGGEEFSILLAETDIGKALEVAERLRSAIEQYPFTLKSAHSDEVLTVSLGVSSRRKGDSKGAMELIREADVALYRSKSLGKNRVTGYSADLTMPDRTQNIP